MDEEIEKKDDIIKNYRVDSVEDICKEVDDKYKKRLDDIVKAEEPAFIINENDLSGEINKTIYKLHTYMTKLAEERMLLSKIERKMKDIHGEIYGNLRKGGQMRFDSKPEVEEWVNRNPKWLKIHSYYEYQSAVCDLYASFVKGMETKQWALKTKADLKKVELGV